MVIRDTHVQEVMEAIKDRIRAARALDKAYLSKNQTIQAYQERGKKKAYMETLELLENLKEGF